jgi:hypothetical protein
MWQSGRAAVLDLVSLLQCVITKRLAISGSGEEMKWAQDPRGLVCIIGAMIFVLWIAVLLAGDETEVTNLLPSTFTIVIDGKPILVFEAKNLREAFELCHEQWLESDLAEATSEGLPLWDGKAKIRARIALPKESALLAEAQNSGQPSDGLILVYLVELDGEAAD